MKKLSKLFISLVVLFIVLAPALSLAQRVTEGELIPCATSYSANNPDCDFQDFLKLINNVVNFVLFNLALPIAAIMFAYAGFKMVTSGGSPEAKSSAKSVFTNTALGFIIAAASWLIIKLILDVLGYNGAWIGF